MLLHPFVLRPRPTHVNQKHRRTCVFFLKIVPIFCCRHPRTCRDVFLFMRPPLLRALLMGLRFLLVFVILSRTSFRFCCLVLFVAFSFRRRWISTTTRWFFFCFGFRTVLRAGGGLMARRNSVLAAARQRSSFLAAACTCSLSNPLATRANWLLQPRVD